MRTKDFDTAVSLVGSHLYKLSQLRTAESAVFNYIVDAYKGDISMTSDRKFDLARTLVKMVLYQKSLSDR